MLKNYLFLFIACLLLNSVLFPTGTLAEAANCGPFLWRPPAPEPHAKPLGTIALLRTLWKNPIEAWNVDHFNEPTVTAKFAGIQATVVNDPAAIRQVLMDNRSNYPKDNLQRRVMTRALSDGLLMSDGDQWKTQRRTLAPIFNQRTVTGFAKAMIDGANNLVEAWNREPDGTVHDVAGDVTKLTLDTLQRTIFSDGLGGDPEEVRTAMRDYFDAIGRIDPFDLMDLPDAIPRFSRLKARSALQFFDRAVDNIIATRRRLMAEHPDTVPNDILSQLLQAKNPDTDQPMSENEIRSNIITFIVAGHETTANTLMWTLYTLSQSKYWRDRVVAEADREFAGPAEGLVDRLVDTRAVIEETIRLYPPIAAISRAAIEADELAGCRIEPGSMVVISPYVIHRHRSLWEEPDGFDPNRFIGRTRESIDRFSYLPFGAGPRVCIGSGFALQNATLVIATLMKNFRLELLPGHKVWPVLKVTLQPEGHQLPMIVHRRVPQ